MEFKTAKLDRTATIVSIIASALLVGISIFFLIMVPSGWAFSMLMMLIIVCCYALSPKTYIFKGGQLIIEKVVGRKIVIPIEDIEAYVRIPNFGKLKVARTFGNGGLFGYYGMFTTAEYGTIKCQLTNLKNVFIIKSKKGVFAVSPAEQDRFEEHLKAVAAGMTVEIKTIEPRIVEKGEYASALILIIPIALFVISVIMVLLTYAQLPDRIAVHFGFQGNPDRWGSKISYLISSIIPASILVAIGISAFLTVRRTTTNRVLANFFVIIVAFIQLFVAYLSIDMYWTNKHNTHLMPLPYSITLFVILMIGLLFYYYRVVKKSA